MKKSMQFPEYQVIRDVEKCIQCEVCVRQCGFEVHATDADTGKVEADSAKCVSCLRCATLCPTQALTIEPYPLAVKGSDNWTAKRMQELWKQAETGGVLLAAMGSDKPRKIIWDHILLDASQVTNPSIDPLREPMELRTYLGRKPEKLELISIKERYEVKTEIPPQLKLESPLMFGAMSYGAISLNTMRSLAQAAKECGIYYNTGEGGLPGTLDRFRGFEADLFTKHNMPGLAYWQAADKSSFIYLITHRDRETSRASWQGFFGKIKSWFGR